MGFVKKSINYYSKNNNDYDMKMSEYDEVIKIEIRDCIAVSDFFEKIEQSTIFDISDKLTKGVFYDSDKDCINSGVYYIFDHNDKSYIILVNGEKIIINEKVKESEEIIDKLFSFNFNDNDYHYCQGMHNKYGFLHSFSYYIKNGGFDILRISFKDFYDSFKDILDNLRSFNDIDNIFDINSIYETILNDLNNKQVRVKQC